MSGTNSNDVNGWASQKAETKGPRQTDESMQATRNADPTDIEARLDAIEAELADLQAGLQALRGYVGNIDRVNESVERRANAALAAVERLEAAPPTPPSLATAGDSAPTETDGEAPIDGCEKATDAESDAKPQGSEDGSCEAGLLDRLATLG